MSAGTVQKCGRFSRRENGCALRANDSYQTGTETVDIPVPVDMAESIEAIAVARHVSRDRATADILREAITGYERRREGFLALAERFQKSTDPAETDQLRGELAQMTFGDR